MIYVLLAIFISAVAYYVVFKNNYIRQKYTNVLNAIFLFVISAAKSIDESPVDDLINYKNIFLESGSMEYDYIMELGKRGDLKDPIFSVVAKFFNSIGFSVEAWMGMIALLFAVCFCYFVFKNSKNVWMSMLILISLHFSFTLTGLRQTMALAFVCLAFNCILQKKPVKFLVFVVIAIMFHSSAILFLPAYLIAKQKVGLKQFLYITIVFFVANFSPDTFRNLIETLAWTEQVSEYADRTVSLSWSGFIIEFAILIFCLFIRNNHLKNPELHSIDMLINCLIVSICFLALSTVVAEAFRLSLYYSIGSAVLIPNVIALEKNKEKRMWEMLISLVFILYIFWSSAYSHFVFF